jgi:hypothetical protein
MESGYPPASFFICLLILFILFKGDPDLLDVTKAILYSHMSPPCEWPVWPVK